MDLLVEVGHRFCDTILDFIDPDQVKVKSVLEELEIMLPKASDSDSEDISNEESDEVGDDDPTKKAKKTVVKAKKAVKGKKGGE